MSSPPKKSIIALKVIRDVLDELVKVVDGLTRIKQKYGIGMNDLNTINLANPEVIQELTSILSPQKLGLLLIAVSQVISLDTDLKNFTAYDEKRLQDFRQKLIALITNLDKVVE